MLQIAIKFIFRFGERVKVRVLLELGHCLWIRVILRIYDLG